jgi:hypothetical protein
MGCAQCHTHRYDPITIDDYYGAYAYFNQTEDADRGDGPRPADAVDRGARCDAAGPRPSDSDPRPSGTLRGAPPRHACTPPGILRLEGPCGGAPHAAGVAVASGRRGEIVAISPIGFSPPRIRSRPVSIANRMVRKSHGSRRSGFARKLRHARRAADASGTARLARVGTGRFGVGICATSFDSWYIRRPSRCPRARRRNPFARIRTIGCSPAPRASGSTPKNFATRHSRCRASCIIGSEGLLCDRPSRISGLSPYSGLRWEESSGTDRLRRGVYVFWRRSQPYAPSRDVRRDDPHPLHIEARAHEYAAAVPRPHERPRRSRSGAGSRAPSLAFVSPRRGAPVAGFRMVAGRAPSGG